MKILMTFGLISCTLMATLILNPISASADTPIPIGTNRKPLTCPSRKSPTKGAPSLAQAKKYFTCLVEQEIHGSMSRLYILVLIDDLNMQISPKPRRFSKAIDAEFIYDIGELKLNTDKPVYPIQGSYTRYTCRDASYLKPGENCEIEKYNQNQGFCFQNDFGDWQCVMKGGPDRNSTRKGAPPQSNSSRDIKIDPNDAETYHIRAHTKALDKDYRGALADYNRAIQINPNIALFYFGRGNVKYILKDRSGGINDWKQAVRMYQQQGDTKAYDYVFRYIKSHPEDAPDL
jgi:tetratricopeptide (TPR) repeat protein